MSVQWGSTVTQMCRKLALLLAFALAFHNATESWSGATGKSNSEGDRRKPENEGYRNPDTFPIDKWVKQITFFPLEEGVML